MGYRHAHQTKVCCLLLSVPILFVIAMVFMFNYIPPYLNHTGEEFVPFLSASIYQTPRLALQLNANVAHYLGNHSRDVCTHPYHFACEIDEPHYPELFYQHNTNLLNGIMTSPKYSDNLFLRLCRSFHSESNHTKLSRIVTHPVYQTLSNAIHGIKLPQQIVAVISRVLHPHGIRDPFHLNILPEGGFQLGRSRLVDAPSDATIRMFLKEHLHYSPQKVDEVVLAARQVHERIFFENPQYEWVDLIEFEKYLHFSIASWFPDSVSVPSHMFISKKTMFHFQQALYEVEVNKWIHFLEYYTIKSLLHQSRSLLNTDVRICQQQFMEYFPLEVCRALRSKVSNHDAIEELQHDMQQVFRKIILEDNLFEFGPIILDGMKADFNRLKIYVNKCSLTSFNETITKIETKYLNATGEVSFESYLDLVFTMIQEPDFQERRSSVYDVYYRNLLWYYSHWNAWFEGSLHLITVPPGILIFPSRKMKHGTYLYYLSMKTVVFHELFHFIYYNVEKYDRIQWSYKYQRFYAEIKMRYHNPPERVHEENMADNFGIWMAYHTWTTNVTRSIQEKKGFLLSYTRIHCRKQADQIQTDHGNPLHRGTLPLLMVHRVFDEVFNCSTRGVADLL